MATPCVGEDAHQVVDLALRADVDAARRLVEDDHPRPHRQPFGEHDLLLVAARQGADRRRRPTGALMASARALRLRVACLAARGRRGRRWHSARGPAARCCSRDRIVQDEPGALAVLRDEVDAAGRWRRAANETIDRPCRRADRAAERRVDAEDRAGELGAAGADEAGEAEDFAAAQREVDRALGIGRRAQRRRRRGRRAPGGAVGRRVERLAGRARSSGGSCASWSMSLAVELADHGAVAQHDDAVGAVLDLVEAVRDEDDADARRLQIGDRPREGAASPRR